MRKSIDEAAFITAYDDYAEAIFRYCYFRTYDRERAQELMQETFTNAWSYLRQGKEIENLKAFLYRTAHNVCVNEMVKSKSISLDEMNESTGYDPESRDRSPEAEAEGARILEQLAELPLADREVLTLRYIEGMAVKDIAAMLGLPPNTVSVRIKRALATLRERYEQTP